MLDRIKRYQRYKDYYAISSFEVKWSLFMTLAFFAFFKYGLNFYQEFLIYQEGIKQIIMAIIGGEFTLLGMSLAGIAIVVSLISPEELKIIAKIDKNDTVNRVLSHFEFSAVNLAVQIIYMFIIYAVLLCQKPKVCVGIFWILCVLIIYHFCFNILYIVSLVGSCISLSSIKNQCYKISQNAHSVIDLANEIRIEYLLKIVLANSGINRHKFLQELFGLLDESQVKNKEEIKDYLRHRYELQ